LLFLALLAYDAYLTRDRKGVRPMKRLTGMLAIAAMTVMMTAGTALAGTNYPPTTSVEATSGGNPPTAFTGADVIRPALFVAVLLVVGLTALFAARRRSARVAG
jgi:hypothetical protein